MGTQPRTLHGGRGPRCGPRKGLWTGVNALLWARDALLGPEEIAVSIKRRHLSLRKRGNVGAWP